MRSSRLSLSPVGSGSDLLSSLSNPTHGAVGNWSQRAWPRASDIIVTGEGFKLDSSHNKPVNSGTTGTTTATIKPPVRSYLQTKVGARRSQKKNEKEEEGGGGGRGESQGDSQRNQNSAADLKNPRENMGGEGEEEKTSVLDAYVEKADLELFSSSRQHLDAINLSTQLQQNICDEMRAQAQIDKQLCESMKNQAGRLQKTADIPISNADQVWVTEAFDDLRKSIADHAHAHRVYCLTLLSQSSAIQQSLDSHRDVMELSKQAPPTNKDTPTTEGSGVKVGGMTFLQATQAFEAVRRPRLKMLSEVDYLTAQVKSIQQQLKDVELLLSGLKEAQNAEQAAWRLQQKVEEARTRQDFLSTRHAQLKLELVKSAAGLTSFLRKHRDKMAEVVDVFRQHRIRCDSTLRKSFSLLKAAARRDRDVLKTLDSRQGKWLSPQRDVSGGEAVDIGKGSSNSSSSLLKRTPSSKNKNPLQTRKVCFGDTHYSDIDLTTGRDNDMSSNHSSPLRGSDGGVGEKGEAVRVTDRSPEKKRKTGQVEGLRGSVSPSKREGKEFDLWAGYVSPSGNEDKGSENGHRTQSPHQISERLKDDWSERSSPSKKSECVRIDRGAIISPSETYGSVTNGKKESSSPTRQYELGKNGWNDTSSPRKNLKWGIDFGNETISPNMKGNTSINSGRDNSSPSRKGQTGISRDPKYDSPSRNIFTRPASKYTTKPDVTRGSQSGIGSPVKGNKFEIGHPKENKSNKETNPRRVKVDHHKIEDKLSANGNKLSGSPTRGGRNSSRDETSMTRGQDSGRHARSASPAMTVSNATVTLDHSTSRSSEDQDYSPDTTIFLSTKSKIQTGSAIKNNIQKAPRGQYSNDDASVATGVGTRPTHDRQARDHTSNSSDAASLSETESEGSEAPHIPDAATTARVPQGDAGRDKRARQAANPRQNAEEASPSQLSPRDAKSPQQGRNRQTTKQTSAEETTITAPSVSAQKRGGTAETGKRRVAFSDVDPESSKASYRSSRPNSASISTGRTGSDRGILKKSTDRNPTSKSIVIKDERAEPTGRIVKSNRARPSSATAPKPPVRQTAILQPVYASTDAFIPESSDDGGSDTSYSPEEISPRERLRPRRAMEEDETMSELLREKSRLEMEEDDHVNRLIRKYANTRRGISLLSKNFNNSDTTVMNCGLLGDGSGGNGSDWEHAQMVGCADRLEFDMDGGRKVKVCAVRPIPTEVSNEHQSTVPMENSTAVTRQRYSTFPKQTVQQHATPTRSCALSTGNNAATIRNPRDSVAATEELIARLRQFEVTAGQFVDFSKTGTETASVQSDTRSGLTEYVSGSYPTEVSTDSNEDGSCLWSAQMYNDRQEDTNNNLSSQSNTSLRRNGNTGMTLSLKSQTNVLLQQFTDNYEFVKLGARAQRCRQENLFGSIVGEMHSAHQAVSPDVSSKENASSSSRRNIGKERLNETHNQVVSNWSNHPEYDGCVNHSGASGHAQDVDLSSGLEHHPIGNREKIPASNSALKLSQSTHHNLLYGCQHFVFTESSVLKEEPLKSCLKRKPPVEFEEGYSLSLTTSRRSDIEQDVRGAGAEMPTDTERARGFASDDRQDRPLPTDAIQSSDKTVDRQQARHRRRVKFSETVFYSDCRESISQVATIQDGLNQISPISGECTSDSFTSYSTKVRERSDNSTDRSCNREDANNNNSSCSVGTSTTICTTTTIAIIKKRNDNNFIKCNNTNSYSTCNSGTKQTKINKNMNNMDKTTFTTTTHNIKSIITSNTINCNNCNNN